MQHDQSHTSAVMPKRPAAFLDRDGVLNVDTGYVYRTEDLTLTPTAVEGVRLLNAAGYLVIVVSNQSGIARGYYREADVDTFHRHMQDFFTAAGARIDAFYYCGFHPDGSVAPYNRAHKDRKPNPGMILRAMRDWAVEPARSFMIGDKETDLEAAARAGISGFMIRKDVGDLAAAVRAVLGRIAAEPDPRARSIAPGTR